MKEDRDKIDDLFRSKLYDFESDALPDDVWDKIEERLPKQRFSISASTRRKWFSAAAAIALLILSGTVYFLQHETVDPVLVQELEQKTEEIKSALQEQEQPVSVVTEPVSAAIAQVREEQAPVLRRAVVQSAAAEMVQPIEDTLRAMADEADIQHEEYAATTETETLQIGDLEEEAVAAPLLDSEPEKKKEKLKRWNFGMGAGSFTAGSNDAASMYAFRNTTMESPQLDFLNSVTDKFGETPKTDIKHRQPVSVGLSASYMLSPRWFLMAGVSYSYLSSDWKTNGTYNSKTEQRLHFIGLPVSLAYKIAEWNNFMWYASAGIKPELNVAGSVKEIKYAKDQMMGTPEKNDLRMKELYWSVNAGTGVSYPLWRYLNAFVEVGAGYYFDNGSTIETIHSDKPFNVNLSFGLRFGF